MPKKTMTGSEIAARMTPEAREKRAREAAYARHYGALVPEMVAVLERCDRAPYETQTAFDALYYEGVEYQGLDHLPCEVLGWLRRKARAQMRAQ